MSQNVLKIVNDYSFFLSDDDNAKHELWSRLRFRDRNYFHNRAYKMKKWDGYINFFSIDTGKFLTGLLPEVSAVLRHFNIPYTVDDTRKQTPFQFSKVNENFLNQWLPEKTHHGEPMSPITLHDYQVDIINQVIKHRRGVVYAPTGSGKAQPLDSLVATPSGFKKMGDIQIGDHVLVPSGGSAPVTGVFPQGKKKILRIEFNNGDSVECCEDHLWKVNAFYDQWKGKILSAKEIKTRKKCPNGASRFNIDTPKNVDFESKTVPLDPYFMGLLLGDGCFCGACLNFSSVEHEILTYISRSLAPGYTLIMCEKDCDFRITCPTNGRKSPNSYLQILRFLGLRGLRSHEKFVPEIYLINDAQKRLALLQGLMDTDGEVSKTGAITFNSTSPHLAEAVEWLVKSLGGIPRRSVVKKWFTYKGIKKQGKLCYKITFGLPEGLLPFRLTWKKDRCKKTRQRNTNRVISDVVEVGEKECQCIMVDHPDHLYITDNFVVTHNTFVMLGIMKAIQPGTPTLVLQNRVSLAQQNYEELALWGFPNVGTCWGGKFSPNVITVASVQSVDKIEKLLPKFKVLIVDEIHDMMSALPKAVYKRMKGADIRVAVSATPFKFGGKDQVQKFYVRGFFGPILKINSAATGVLTTHELQEREILSSSKGTFYVINEPQIPHDIYIDAVTRGIAESYHFHQIVTRLARMQKGRTLILVERIAHGDALHSMLPGSLWVQGKDDSKTRKDVVRQLQKSKNVVAIATQQIFNTGINFHCHNLINAAGGQADHLIIQRMGRGLRTAEDKERLNYFDFLFKINQYLEEHSNKRIKILEGEGHEITVKEVDF